jgi:hypothetical protein
MIRGTDPGHDVGGPCSLLLRFAFSPNQLSPVAFSACQGQPDMSGLASLGNTLFDVISGESNARAQLRAHTARLVRCRVREETVQ